MNLLQMSHGSPGKLHRWYLESCFVVTNLISSMFLWEFDEDSKLSRLVAYLTGLD